MDIERLLPKGTESAEDLAMKLGVVLKYILDKLDYLETLVTRSHAAQAQVTFDLYKAEQARLLDEFKEKIE